MPNKLVGLRASLDKTQKDFAELLGITQGTYSKKEKSKGNEFTRSEIQVLINYLRIYFPNITADEIFFNWYLTIC